MLCFGVFHYLLMKDKIHELKMLDAHFRKLLDDYHNVDHEIYSYESGAKVTTDEHLNKLRSRRIRLKGESYLRLKN